MAFISISCQITRKPPRDKNTSYHSSSYKMLSMYFHSLRKVIVLNIRTSGAVYHAHFAFSDDRSVPGVFKSSASEHVKLYMVQDCS